MVNTVHTRAQHPRATKSVGLWGAPQSGKTTYLAALYFAVARSTMDLNIFGANAESTDFIVSGSHVLSSDHMFPAATQMVSSYSWTVNMTTRGQVPIRGRFGRQNVTAVPQYSQFNLDMRDAPGGFYGIQQSPPGPLSASRVVYGSKNPLGRNSPSPVPDTEDMMDYLGGSEGLLLLIDPVREQEFGDSHEYFSSTLLRIAQRRLALMSPGSRLPHYVAVCITKFDHPKVHGFARMNGYLTYDENDPYLFPRVHDEDAESFFKEFCENSTMSDPDLVTNAMARYFRPERIRYFVTSAIGFYLHGARFRDDDFENAVKQGDGSYRIRGQIHPINVLEPMLWLGRSVTAVG